QPPGRGDEPVIQEELPRMAQGHRLRAGGRGEAREAGCYQDQGQEQGPHTVTPLMSPQGRARKQLRQADLSPMNAFRDGGFFSKERGYLLEGPAATSRPPRSASARLPPLPGQPFLILPHANSFFVS